MPRPSWPRPRQGTGGHQCRVGWWGVALVDECWFWKAQRVGRSSVHAVYMTASMPACLPALPIAGSLSSLRRPLTALPPDLPCAVPLHCPPPAALYSPLQVPAGAPGLLLRRPGLSAGGAGAQPHLHAQGKLPQAGGSQGRPQVSGAAAPAAAVDAARRAAPAGGAQAAACTLPDRTTSRRTVHHCPVLLHSLPPCPARRMASPFFSTRPAPGCPPGWC